MVQKYGIWNATWLREEGTEEIFLNSVSVSGQKTGYGGGILKIDSP